MESMDEFDQATPVCRQYCTPVTNEEYEMQTSKATEKALGDLISYMEQNPNIYKEILKKKKQEDIENGGILSFLKTRFLVAIGQEAVEVTEEENCEKMTEVTDKMVKAFNYSQETKDTPVRFSRRLALKNARQKARLQQQVAPSPGPPRYPPPPPPPPVPLLLLPPSPPPLPSQRSGRSTTPLVEKTNTINSPQVKRKSTEGLKKAEKKAKKGTPKSGGSSIANLHKELLKFSHNKLKSTTQLRSPGGTPMKKANGKRKISATSARSELDASPQSGFSPLSAFNTKMLEKFRNTRSPISNVSSPASGFNSPYDSTFSSP